MIKEEIKSLPSNIMEGFISIKSVIEGYENKTSDRKILKVCCDENKKKQREKELAYLNKKSKELGFEIEMKPTEYIDSYSLSKSNGGLIAFCTDRTYKPLTNEDVIFNGFYVLIEGVEDPYNFGFCIRSMYAFGVDGIILNSRSWMNASGVICRSSAGTSELINIYISDTLDAINTLKSKGYTCIASDLSKNSKSICDVSLSYPIFLLIGGEKRGLTKIALENCDEIVKIDYSRPFHSALTSASSSTILAYEIFRQNRGKK